MDFGRKTATAESGNVTRPVKNNMSRIESVPTKNGRPDRIW